jgi:DNA (cytosine-5)-methyltransferase 1
MREMLSLQGFPKSFKIVCNYSETRKQAGNSVPVPMISAVINEVLAVIKDSASLTNPKATAIRQEVLPINF